MIELCSRCKAGSMLPMRDYDGQIRQCLSCGFSQPIYEAMTAPDLEALLNAQLPLPLWGGKRGA